MYKNSLLSLCLVLLLVSCTTYYQGPKSDHFDGKNFFNPHNSQKKGYFKAIKWMLSREIGPWPEHVEITPDNPPGRVMGETLRVSFIGHSTVLIQTQGLNILTDPLYEKYASPIEGIGPRRIHKPGVAFSDLPAIDFILISHNHYDHLDIKTIYKLWERDRPKILVPLGNDTILREYKGNIKPIALDWDDKVIANVDVKIHLQPVQHWSARGLFDRNKALWGAFVIETSSGNIYFSGDTGYGRGRNFYYTQSKFKKFRLALLPIGAYKPRWLMKYSHTNPEEAVLVHKILNACYSMAIHYGCLYEFTDEGYKKPVEDLQKALKKHHVSKKHFKAIFPGNSWYIPLK